MKGEPATAPVTGLLRPLQRIQGLHRAPLTSAQACPALPQPLSARFEAKRKAG